MNHRRFAQYSDRSIPLLNFAQLPGRHEHRQLVLTGSRGALQIVPPNTSARLEHPATQHQRVEASGAHSHHPSAPCRMWAQFFPPHHSDLMYRSPPQRCIDAGVTTAAT